MHIQSGCTRLTRCISAGATFSLADVFQDGRSSLHWSCSGGHAGITDYLVSMGANVNLPDDVVLDSHNFSFASRC